MALGKPLCGAWLVRFPVSARSPFGGMHSTASRTAEPTMSGGQANNARNQNAAAVAAAATASRPASQAKKSTRLARKPMSRYPAGIVSCAMVARGEIGFLISSVAETKGIFRSSSSSTTSSTPGEETSELFLIITWAIFLCTILGPLCVGLLVRRVKRPEGRIHAPGQVEGSRENVLGIWGVI